MIEERQPKGFPVPPPPSAGGCLPAVGWTAADWSVYGFLKLQLYLQLAQSSDQRRELPTFFRAITVMKLTRILNENRSPASVSPFLLGLAGHALHRRLLSLCESGVLQKTEVWLRRRRVFSWVEPLYERNICYARGLVALAGSELDLALDAWWTFLLFGSLDLPRLDQPGDTEAVIARLRAFGHSVEGPQWPPRPNEFRVAFMQRRSAMLRKGLLEARPPEAHAARLSPTGFEVAFLCDLLIHNNQSVEPVAACPHCRGAAIGTRG